ncbi:hypothetical protein OB236_36210, partial [Paenibacillus sp. WQ 127069]
MKLKQLLISGLCSLLLFVNFPANLHAKSYTHSLDFFYYDKQSDSSIVVTSDGTNRETMGYDQSIRFLKLAIGTTDVETFERGTYEGTNFEPGSGSITNDPQKVITGNFSAYVEVPRTQDWSAFT